MTYNVTNIKYDITKATYNIMNITYNITKVTYEIGILKIWYTSVRYCCELCIHFL